MPFVQENWLLILVAFVSGAMLVWPLVQRRFSPMKNAGTADVTRLINSSDANLLDVRETKDYEAGRLPNATHIPLSQLPARSGELKRQAGKPLVVYCENGSRSHAAGAALAKAGLTDLYRLNGGFRAWKDAGLPVEKAR